MFEKCLNLTLEKVKEPWYIFYWRHLVSKKKTCHLAKNHRFLYSVLLWGQDGVNVRYKDFIYKWINAVSFGQIALPGEDCSSQAVDAVHLTEHLPLLRPDSWWKSFLIGKNKLQNQKSAWHSSKNRLLNYFKWYEKLIGCDWLLSLLSGFFKSAASGLLQAALCKTTVTHQCT